MQETKNEEQFNNLQSENTNLNTERSNEASGDNKPAVQVNEENQDCKQRTIFDETSQVEKSDNEKQSVKDTDLLKKDAQKEEVSEKKNEDSDTLKDNANSDIDANKKQENKKDEQAAKKEEIDLSKIDDKDEASKILESKGFDYSSFQREFDETGDISQESREKLMQSGISSELIDNYIEGQKAKVEAQRNEFSEYIGGRENFDKVLVWAANNLNQDEINSYNAQRDKNIIRIILKDLKMRMEQEEGVMPNYIKGDGGKPFEDIFRSQAEMFEAISNPKYKKDEAYRKDVQKKIAASTKAGVDLGI